MLKNLFTKKPKEKFSLENLKYLYGVLVKEPVISPNNKGRIVEVVRSIAELIIWGDQHSGAFFDFFAEKNILSNFVRILSQKTDNKVKVQIIQTLSILVQNLSNEVSVFYLLSNNYINDLIVHRFDFADEEIVTYYINFLKSLSFKLNSRTILFFFNEVSQDFPLFNEAIKFFNHPDSMIRIAVRTLTLNVLRINDLSLRRYLLQRSAVPYFSHLVWFLRDATVEFDRMVHSAQATPARLEVASEHLFDQLYYLQDVLNCGAGEEEVAGGGFTTRDDSDAEALSGAAPSAAASASPESKVGGLYFQHLLSEILLDQLLGYYVLPLLCGSLVPALSTVPAHQLISPRVSFFLLTHLLSIFTHADLVNAIVGVLVRANLPPIALRLIQEPPRGPVRNSDGTPLTALLYPQSRQSRQANVLPELALLHQNPADAPRGNKRHSHATSSNSTSHSGGGIVHTPKPVRETLLTSSNSFSSRSQDVFVTTPSHSPTASPEASPEPPRSARTASRDMELQTLAPHTTVAAVSPAAGPKPDGTASTQPNTPVSTTATDGTAGANHSREVSVSSSPSSPPPPAESEAVVPNGKPAEGDAKNANGDGVSASPPAESASTDAPAEPVVDASSAAATTATASPVESPAASSLAASLPLPSASPSAPAPAASAGGPAPVPAPLSPPPADGWPCPACTYMNQADALGCSICETVRPTSPGMAAALAVALEADRAAATQTTTTGGVTSSPVTPAPSSSSALATPISNPSLASAYLTPVSSAPTSTPASTPASAPGLVRSASSVRDIPIDENSRARSKLPDVGPLYSPIDYFGFTKPVAGEDASTLDSVTGAPGSAASSGRNSPAPSAPSSFSSPSFVSSSSSSSLLFATAQRGKAPDHRRLLEEAEPNEYAAALLRFLAAAQSECVPLSPSTSDQGDGDAGPLSPVSPLPLSSPERHALGLDERDIYGSMSVLYTLLRHEKSDPELLLAANLCAQSHRKSRRLLAALVADRDRDRDLLGLGASPLTPAAPRTHEDKDKLPEEGSSGKTASAAAAAASLWGSPIQTDLQSSSESPAAPSVSFAIRLSEVDGPLAASNEKDAPAESVSASAAELPSSDSPSPPAQSHSKDPSTDASPNRTAAGTAASEEAGADGLEAPPETSAAAASADGSPVAEEVEDEAAAAAASALLSPSSENGRPRAPSSDPLMQKSTHRRVVSIISPAQSPAAPRSASASISKGGSGGAKGRALFLEGGDLGLDLSNVSHQQRLADPTSTPSRSQDRNADRDGDEDADGSGSLVLDASPVVDTEVAYNETLVGQLLHLANHHPPYRMVTLQTMVELVKEFVVTDGGAPVAGGASGSAAAAANATEASSSTGPPSLPAHSYLLPSHVAQLDALYARLVVDLRTRLSDPSSGLLVLDLFEDEFPAWTSPGPGFEPSAASATSVVKKILGSVLHLLPIERSFVRDVAMEYRVQPSAPSVASAALMGSPLPPTHNPSVSSGGAHLPAPSPSAPMVSSATGAALSPTVSALAANAAAATAAAIPLANHVERLRKAVQLLLLVRNLRLKNALVRDTLFYSAPIVAPPGIASPMASPVPASSPGGASSPLAPPPVVSPSSASTASPSASPSPPNTSTSLQPLQSRLFHQSHLSVRQEILTAHHPDAMLCTLQLEPRKKAHLFFVVDTWDLCLVELQQSKPGTAVVQLRHSLRHQEAFLNRNNACLLHVTIRSAMRPHQAARRLAFPGDACWRPLWVVTLLFLDAIQCTRAFKHLETRRLSLRKNMLAKLLNELDAPALPLSTSAAVKALQRRRMSQEDDEGGAVSIDEAALHSMAAGCAVARIYPGVEADVHADSVAFGIPNLPPPPPPATPAPTTAPPPPESASASAAPAPAPAATHSPPPSSAPAVPLPVALPVASPAPSPRNGAAAATTATAATAAPPTDLFASASAAAPLSPSLAALVDEEIAVPVAAAASPAAATAAEGQDAEVMAVPSPAAASS